MSEGTQSCVQAACRQSCWCIQHEAPVQPAHSPQATSFDQQCGNTKDRWLNHNQLEWLVQRRWHHWQPCVPTPGSPEGPDMMLWPLLHCTGRVQGPAERTWILQPPALVEKKYTVPLSSKASGSAKSWLITGFLKSTGEVLFDWCALTLGGASEDSTGRQGRPGVACRAVLAAVQQVQMRHVTQQKWLTIAACLGRIG